MRATVIVIEPPLIQYIPCFGQAQEQLAVEGVDDRFGGEHSRLHRRVNAFDSLSVEKRRRIADD